jgi:hypothetical protein
MFTNLLTIPNDGHHVQIVLFSYQLVPYRVELLPCFKLTGKTEKINEFTGKIGKAGKR